MSPIHNLFVWLTGHRSTQGAEHQAFYQGLAVVGGATAVACVLALLNASAFGFMLGEGLAQPARWLLAAACGALGLAMVLVFDRAAIYLMDTRGDMGRSMRWGYLLVRTTSILVLSSFTAQAVMPLLLAKELQAQALRMRERSDAQRLQTLRTQGEVGKKEQASALAEAAAQQALLASNALPPDIAEQLRSAQTCWQRVATLRQRLNALPEDDEAQAERLRQRIAAQKAQCNEQLARATAARDAHLVSARQAASQAREAAASSAQGLQAAQTEVARRRSQAELLEREAYTPSSSEVLQALIAESPGARVKWLLLTALQVLFELMPLLLKGMLGTSVPGRELAVRQQAALQRANRRLSAEQEEDALREAMQALSRQSAAQLLNSPTAQVAMRAEQERVLMATATLEHVRRYMAELAQQQAEVDAFTRQHPSHAAALAQVWHQALARATHAMLQGPLQPSASAQAAST